MSGGYINKQNVEILLNSYLEDEIIRFNTENARELEEKGFSELPDKTIDAMELIIELNKQDDIIYNWLVLKRDLTMK